jgi:hypothetical protein
MTTVIGVIPASLEEGWARYHADALDPLGFFDRIVGGGFKIGEGGWQYTVPPTKIPKLPSNVLSDLDCIENAGTYPVDSRYVFPPGAGTTKPFESILFVAPNIVRVECLVDFGEANLDAFGFPPEFWELGVYDSMNHLVGYFTFSVDTKYPTTQLLYEIDIII